MPPADAADFFDQGNAVNPRGVRAAMKHELWQTREQGRGAIGNCSSLGGLAGLPERAAYHAARHGVIGLTRSAAVEYAPRGVRVNAVSSGRPSPSTAASASTDRSGRTVTARSGGTGPRSARPLRRCRSGPDPPHESAGRTVNPAALRRTSGRSSGRRPPVSPRSSLVGYLYESRRAGVRSGPTPFGSAPKGIPLRRGEML